MEANSTPPDLGDVRVSTSTRGIGSGHPIVFVFNNPVRSATTSVTDAADMSIAGASASPSSKGNELIVTLTGIAGRTRAKVKAKGVSTVQAKAGNVLP